MQETQVVQTQTGLKSDTIEEGIKNGRYLMVNVLGDTMEPTFRHGDIVFVDTEKRNCSGGGIFHFTGMGSNIARVIPVTGDCIELYRDHPAYRPMKMSKSEFDSMLVGKVVAHLKVYV